MDRIRAVTRRKVFFCSSFHLCENNSYLGTQIYEFLKRNGHIIVSNPRDADVLVVNTCGFDQSRENEALALVRRLALEHGARKPIVVAGCLPKINPSVADFPGVTTIGPKELERFDGLFSAGVPIREVKANRLNKGLAAFGFPDDYYIMICQGCVNACSYCAIKKAKGPVVSKPADEIADELEAGLKLGFKRIVLLADDCGSYGLDIGTDFAELLNRLAGTAGDFQLNIHYFEPRRLLTLLPKIRKEVFKRVYFINIPVQTASQRLLKLMNRRYALSDVARAASAIKSANPAVHLQTHVLYGFPTETRKDFCASFALGKVFDSVVYFFYTPKRGTAAAKLESTVSRTELMYRIFPISKAEAGANAGNMAKWQVASTSFYATDVFSSIRRDIALEALDVVLVEPGSAGEEKALPLALLCEARPLPESGLNVEVLDQRLEDDVPARVREISRRNKLSCVGVCLSREAQREIVPALLRALVKLRLPIAVFGPLAKGAAKGLLEAGASCVITGPNLAAAVQALKAGKDPARLKGVLTSEGGRPWDAPRPHSDEDPPYYLASQYLDRYALGLLRAGDKPPELLIERLQTLLSFVRKNRVRIVDADFLADKEHGPRFADLLSRTLAGADEKDRRGFEWSAEMSPSSASRLPAALLERLKACGLSRIDASA